MNQLFEASVNTERFSMSSVYASVIAREEYAPAVEFLQQFFTRREASHILQALIRCAFYVEPVKQPKIDSTKFAVRWADSLRNDPRFASYVTCVLIFENLLATLQAVLQGNPEKQELLRIIADHTFLSYELNIDYENRPIQGRHIHTPDNISFFWDELPMKVFALRKYLLNPNNHKHIEFFKATYDKIAVKSFLTDRVLTGVHKTNREKRWECHPNSVHFALRKECLAIEAKLIGQICHFEGFPEELKWLLSDNDVIQFSGEVTRCPITLDPISFAKFQREVLNPVHGKAAFQVGHLHPLKLRTENKYSGHTAENISWVSSEGNRIQGELSVEETRTLILRIVQNYKAAGLIP